MSLRALARSVDTPTAPKLPARANIAFQSDRLREKYETSAAGPTALDPEALLARFHKAIHGGHWDAISLRDWRMSLWVAFAGSPALADSDEYFDRLLERLRSKPRRAAYQQMISVYLRDFNPSRAAIRKLAQELDGAVRQFNWVWSARHQDHEIFDPSSGPQRVAKLCLATKSDPIKTLDSLGIGNNLLNGEFASHVWMQGVIGLQAALTRERPNSPLLRTVLDWSQGANGLRYPTHRALLATALLKPWMDRQPAEDLRETISEFLLRFLKDPRLPANAAGWVGVDDDAIAVLRKWMTKVALEQFFQVVDEAAEERMWHYRRAFWSAYDDANAIADAWVLFGPKSLNFARRTFGDVRGYGELMGSQDRSQSVLLMRIDKLVIADWSHNGQCHIWLDGNKFAPKLYLGQYSRRHVVSNSDNGGQVHYSSEYGTWQSKVEQFIQSHTGIKIPQSGYMPEGWRR